MSVIGVKKDKNKIIIVADSQESFGDSLKKNVDGIKLRRVSENTIIGGAGNGHIMSLFYAYVDKNPLDNIIEAYELIEYFTQFNKWTKDIMNEVTEDLYIISSVQFLLIIKEKVWEFNNFYIRELKDGEITSIGSGADQLLCCMELTDSLIEGIRIVCKYNVHCSEPLNIIEVNNNG